MAPQSLCTRFWNVREGIAGCYWKARRCTLTTIAFSAGLRNFTSGRHEFTSVRVRKREKATQNEKW